MNTASKISRYQKFAFPVVIGGALICGRAVVDFPMPQLGLPLALLALATIVIASRIVVKFERFGTHMSVSDVFIFLTLLLFGKEAAVLVGTAESFFSSMRVTRRPLTMAFNAAAMAYSTFATASAVELVFGSAGDLVYSPYSLKLILATSLMGVVQYLVNSGLVSIAAAFYRHKPIWATWKNQYLCGALTYLSAALAAGMIGRLIDVVGFYAFIAVTPIVGLLYYAYLNYARNLEASNARVESEKRFHRAFDHAPIGMALASLDGLWLQVNHSLCDLVGYSEKELLGTDYQSLTHPEDLDRTAKEINQVIARKMPACQIEKRYCHKDGREVHALVGVSLLSDGQGELAHLIFQIQDITDRKQAEQKLLHDAYHDALTGLSNRAWFVEQLKDLLAAQGDTGSLFGVLFLDLDRFKVINDSIGHIFGDELLIKIAARLKACLRPDDKIARLGGDEFTILLSNVHRIEDITEVAKRVQQELSRPFNLGGYETFTTVSIGIAVADRNYKTPEDILRDADTAMYQAKKLGKARYVIFEKGMHVKAMNLLQLETDLRRAIDREEFTLQYQPIVVAESGELSGFEALVRWRHPERGFIPPDKFISVAEETGLIVPIGRWVFAEACSQMKQWEEEYAADLPLQMSINLSSKQFAHAELLEQIIHTLQITGINPHKLKLEITESVVMENMDVATEMMQQLRALGIELSIDDFGTGYSSLSYLHRLPIDTLKIDRSFVGRLEENNENKEIVRTIILLAHNLNMQVVAEGVETREQLDILRQMDCEYGQGYLFARPLDADVAGRWIQERMEKADGTLTLKNDLLDSLDFPVISKYSM